MPYMPYMDKFTLKIPCDIERESIEQSCFRFWANVMQLMWLASLMLHHDVAAAGNSWCWSCYISLYTLLHSIFWAYPLVETWCWNKHGSVGRHFDPLDTPCYCYWDSQINLDLVLLLLGITLDYVTKVLLSPSSMLSLLLLQWDCS